MAQANPHLKVLNPGTGGASCGTGSRPTSQEESRLLREIREIVERSRGTPNALSPVFVQANGDNVEGTFSLHEQLALVSEIHHQPVDGRHVWVGVKEGALSVLDEEDHAVFSRLRRGETPAAVRSALAAERGVSESEAWDRIAHVLALVARGGLLRDLQGANDRAKLPLPHRFSRFHLTKACQLECAHCYADSSPHIDRSDELPTARWRQLLTDFANNSGEQVLFTGGEALLHSGCVDLMRLGHERGLKVTLFTNGLLVPAYADDIGKYADVVQVSLDGPDAATNDLVRGTDTYDRIIKAIDMLVAQGTPTRIGMTVVPSLWKAWREKFEPFAERYAHHRHVEFKLSYGIMQYGRGTDIELTEAPDQVAIDRYLAGVNGRDVAKITRVRPGCGYAEQLVVGPDGTVYPCHLLDGPICHIDDHPLPEIIALLRGLIYQTDVDHIEGCSTCEIRYLCGGSCRVIGSHKTGSRLVTDCTPKDKAQKYSNLARAFASQATL